MSNEIMASIKRNLTVVHGVDEDTRAVAGNGGGGKRISIKGGVFRKFVGGKQVSALEGRTMNVIFVKLAHAASRTYYEKTYKEGEKISPACWSSDGKAPDAEVRRPAAASCDACQFSVKGSGKDGNGTACRLQWRTAVVLPQDPEGDVMQLVLPPTSCFGKEDNGRWPFRPYIQMLANNNISAGRVITQLQFDVNSPVPKLLFSPVAAVPEEVIEIIQQQAASPTAVNAVKLTVFQTDEEAEVAPVEMAESVAETPSEPVLRESSRKPEVAESDVPDVIKKWAKKK